MLHQLLLPSHRMRTCSSATLAIVFVLTVLFSSPGNAVAFTPRTTAPSTTDYHYNSTQNPFYPQFKMPNCTAYAWGRAWEIRGAKPPAGYTGNAKTWWKTSAPPLPQGKAAKLGAIAVWGGAPGYPNYGAGHVAVVEAIRGSDVIVSESSYGGFYFRYGKSVSHISAYGQCGPLLGYIYTGGHTSRGECGHRSVIVDFNGDGKSDVLNLLPDGRWLVSYSATGKYVKINTAKPDPSRVFVADFNGDKKSDVLNTHADGRWLISYSGTTRYRQVQSKTMVDPARLRAH
jgi:surface antigen